jgi:UDP-perosamine 4-acetyltransferase
MDGFSHHSPNPGVSAAVRQQVLIYGAGALGRVMRDMVEREGMCVASFVDDGADGRVIDGISVEVPSERVLAGRTVLNAVLDPLARRSIAARVQGLGGRLGSFVSRAAFVSPSARVGAGCTVFPHAYLMAGARLGESCHVHHFCMVGHDALLGEFCAVGPHCSIGGGVNIGDDCLLGQGVVICPGIEVGAGSVVGAAAYVGGHVPPHSRVISASARTFGPRPAGQGF